MTGDESKSRGVLFGRDDGCVSPTEWLVREVTGKTRGKVEPPRLSCAELVAAVVLRPLLEGGHVVRTPVIAQLFGDREVLIRLRGSA